MKVILVEGIFLFVLCLMTPMSVKAQEFNEGVKTTVTSGKLEIVELNMPQFDDNRARKIRVWLPEGYNPSDTKKTYPVIYMSDGQNLFDTYTSFAGEWKVDESISNMMKDGYEGAIVVGIDNGGNLRSNELSPAWKLSDVGSSFITNPGGDKYAAFVTETVKPYIDAHYNTKPERKYTGIGGSSMGGTISLYIAMEYPKIYGFSMILSPALQIYEDGTIEKYIDSKQYADIDVLPNLYIYAGGNTGYAAPNSGCDEGCIEKYVDIIKNQMLKDGYPEAKIKTLVVPGNTHNESAWAEVFPYAYKWFIDTTSENTKSVSTTNNNNEAVNVNVNEWSFIHLVTIDAIYYLIQHLKSN